jgi:phospholipase C
VNRRLALVAVVGAALVAPGVAAGATTPGAAPARPGSLRHLVVMTQSGRSFDNYFGARPGVDNIPAVACQKPSHVTQPSCVQPHPLGSNPTQVQLRSSAAVQQASVAKGAMNGFVTAQTTRESDGTAALGYFRPGSLPLVNDLADRGVLFDHWFGGVPGGSVANRLFDITARTTGDPSTVPTAGWTDQAVIFDRLTNAGIPWRIYVQNYEPALTIDTASSKQRRGGQVTTVPLLALRRYLDSPSALGHVVDLSRYYRDAATGTLPAVSFVVASSTEQAPQNPAKGQSVARSVVNALIAGPDWPSSSFLLQYDSSGGWYDHVRPPRMNGATVGLRVPALMISPFVVPGTVDHRTYDAASTLRLIETTWSVEPLAERDRTAGDLRKAMNLAARSRAPALIGLPTDQRVPQPDSTYLYLGYLGAIGSAFAIIAGVVWTTTLRDRRAKVRVVTP